MAVAVAVARFLAQPLFGDDHSGVPLCSPLSQAQGCCPLARTFDVGHGSGEEVNGVGRTIAIGLHSSL